MIIVEGPDDSGKSTLANLLAVAIGGISIHSPGVIHHEETFRERKFWYDKLITLPNIVLDRCFYISEYVYGPVLRQHSFITTQMMIEYIQDVTLHGGLFIFCEQRFPSKNKNEALHLSKTERENLEKDVKQSEARIVARYHDVFLNMKKYMSNPIRIRNIDDYIHAIYETRNRQR